MGSMIIETLGKGNQVVLFHLIQKGTSKEARLSSVTPYFEGWQYILSQRV